MTDEDLEDMHKEVLDEIFVNRVIIGIIGLVTLALIIVLPFVFSIQ
jgi:hypothetical protein